MALNKFEKSKAAMARGAKVLGGGTNSNFRAGVSPTPLVIDRGEGAYLIDVDGNRHVDYYCAMGPIILGHNPPAVIEAAKRYGVRAVGIDIDPQRIAEANANAKAAGVSHLVQFRNADLFESNISEATVVTLYLLPRLNVKLRPKLEKELKKGTRVVSHDFETEGWKPTATSTVDGRTVYLWVI